MFWLYDPIQPGFVKSLQEPGGNITGIRTNGFADGGLDWIIRIVPDLKKMYVPFNPDDKSMAILMEDLKPAAEKRKVELIVSVCRTNKEVFGAMDQIPNDVQAVWEIASLFWAPYVDRFIASAIQHKKLLIATHVDWVEKGALMGYGQSNEALGKQAGRIAAKILKGQKPAILPVESSEMFFHVNLKISEAIGLKVPYPVLKQADRIIR